MTFKFIALDTAIDRVLSVRGIDLVRTEWLKALGEGLHSLESATTPMKSPVCAQHGLTQAELAERCGID